MIGSREEKENADKTKNNEDRNKIKELLKFEFEVLAVVGLIVGLLGIDISSQDVVGIIILGTVGIYYLTLIPLVIFPILANYITELKKISEERIDLTYKLIFVQILVSFGLIINVIGTSRLWGSITTLVFVLGFIITLVPTTLCIYRKKTKKRKE